MKRFLQIFSLLLFASMAYSQSQRLVFLEEFTQASCPPCEATTPQLNAAVSANADKIVQLRYQVSWPGYDPMHLDNTAEVNDRVAYYGVGGVPDLYGDGEPIAGNNQTIIPQSEIDSRYSIESPIKVEVSHIVSSDLKSVDVLVKIKNEGTSMYTLTNDKLRVVIIEEDITYPFTPGSTSIKVYEAVMKKFITGTVGMDVPQIGPGETWEQEWTEYSLPSTIYDFNKIAIVAFVQDDQSKGIANSGYSEAQAITGYADIVSDGTLEIGNGLCNLEFTPKITVTNVGDAKANGFIVRLLMNNSVFTSFESDEQLDPGSSIDITLDKQNFPGGNSTVIFHTELKSGIDLSRLNNFSDRRSVQKIGDAIENYDINFENTAIGLAPSNTLVAIPFTFYNFITVDNSVFGTNEPFGAKGESDKALAINFWNWNPAQLETNQGNMIILEKFVPRAGAKFSFDWAYTSFSGSSDRLQMQISEDCGVTFKNLFNKAGAALRTAPEFNNDTLRFVPSSSQWLSSEHDLSSYAGKEIVLRVFVTSDWGDMLYIDNLKITQGPSDVNELSSDETLEVNPNPATASTTFEFNLASPSEVRYSVTDALGKLVENKNLGNTSGKFNHTFDVSDYKSGLYFVNFQLGERQVVKRLMVIH